MKYDSLETNLKKLPPLNGQRLTSNKLIQGGPGASGVGYGNFEELGPLDINLNRRETSWTGLAHTLFVDNPVGSGYRCGAK